MAQNFLRYQSSDGPRWGRTMEQGVQPLPNSVKTVVDVAAHVRLSDASYGDPVDLESIVPLATVQSPCRIVCQGKNYADHRIETGSSPERPSFNMMFSKSDTSLTSAVGKVIKPRETELLDYEIELGLVIGRPLQGANIDETNWTEYVLGLTICNDISARDIQIGQEQWFKGKSFPTFCPAGPYLAILDANDWSQWQELELELRVNGEVRQKAKTADLLFRPWETLAEIARFSPLQPGDLVLTGTPGGVALSLPSGRKKRLAEILFSPQKRLQLFFQRQHSSSRYLKVGDEVRASIRTASGQIDLGEQRLTVIADA